jgi:hypothetical protein
MLFVSSERAAHLLFVVAAIGWSFFPLGGSHLLSPALSSSPLPLVIFTRLEQMQMLYGKSGFQIYAIIACVIVMWMQKEYDRVVILEEQTLQPIPFKVKRLQMYRYV